MPRQSLRAEHLGESEMSETGRIVAIDILAKLKLGAIYGWTAPIPLHDVGPSDKERFDKFEATVRRTEEQVREYLEALGDQDIRSLIDENADGPTAEGFDNLLREEIDALLRGEPIWVALGFGHPDHVADFNYWSKVGLLSVQEATLLSVGLEPDKEHADFLERVRDAAGNPKKNEQAFFCRRDIGSCEITSRLASQISCPCLPRGS
jgi:hypothetical protein